jgi:hypothetical protein
VGLLGYFSKIQSLEHNSLERVLFDIKFSRSSGYRLRIGFRDEFQNKSISKWEFTMFPSLRAFLDGLELRVRFGEIAHAAPSELMRQIAFVNPQRSRATMRASPWRSAGAQRLED